MKKNLVIYGILFLFTVAFYSNNNVQPKAWAESSSTQSYSAVNLLDNSVVSFPSASKGVLEDERILAIGEVTEDGITDLKISTVGGTYTVILGSEAVFIVNVAQKALIKVNKSPEDLKKIQMGDILVLTKVDSYVLDVQTQWGSNLF